MVHRANKDIVSALSAVTVVAVVAVLPATLSALALALTLAALILLAAALVLITVSTSTTPRLPIGRVLRLIKCIVHLFTCLSFGRLRRSPRWKPRSLGNLLKAAWLDESG